MVRFLLTQEVAAHDTAEVWPVYESVFGDYSDCDTWRQAVWDRHSVRDGFRLARAYDGDALIGFAYGYTGQHGQWWTDNAPHDRWLLMTSSDADDPARRLYASEGWRVLGRGIGDDTVIMGRTSTVIAPTE